MIRLPGCRAAGLWFVRFVQNGTGAQSNWRLGISGLPYDVGRDLAPIMLIAAVPNLLVVNPAVPARSLRELIEQAKWAKVIKASGARPD